MAPGDVKIETNTGTGQKTRGRMISIGFDGVIEEKMTIQHLPAAIFGRCNIICLIIC